jgi:hypothetical protein
MGRHRPMAGLWGEAQHRHGDDVRPALPTREEFEHERTASTTAPSSGTRLLTQRIVVARATCQHPCQRRTTNGDDRRRDGRARSPLPSIGDDPRRPLAPSSKTGGCRFESCRPCRPDQAETRSARPVSASLELLAPAEVGDPDDSGEGVGPEPADVSCCDPQLVVVLERDAETMLRRVEPCVERRAYA